MWSNKPNKLKTWAGVTNSQFVQPKLCTFVEKCKSNNNNKNQKKKKKKNWARVALVFTQRALGKSQKCQCFSKSIWFNRQLFWGYINKRCCPSAGSVSTELGRVNAWRRVEWEWAEKWRKGCYAISGSGHRCAVLQQEFGPSSTSSYHVLHKEQHDKQIRGCVGVPLSLGSWVFWVHDYVIRNLPDVRTSTNTCIYVVFVFSPVACCYMTI